MKSSHERRRAKKERKNTKTNESRDASNFFTFTYAMVMLSAYGFRFRFSFWAFVGRCVCRSSAVPNYFTSHLARWRFQASNTAKLAIESDRLALWLTIMISSGPSGVLQHYSQVCVDAVIEHKSDSIKTWLDNFWTFSSPQNNCQHFEIGSRFCHR